MFNNERERGPVASTAGTSGTLAGTTVNVAANRQWTDTGITVNQGDRVMFQASGEINYGRTPGQTATPDGGADRRPNYPDPSVPVGALIGKIGNNGKPFAIGTQSQALVDAGIGPPVPRRERQRAGRQQRCLLGGRREAVSGQAED